MSKTVVGIAIGHDFADRPNWNKLFRNNFSWSQMQAVIDTHSLNNYQ
ncbi:hypothetical protein QUB56_17215 [Microcoleus sp. AR_TQ3_B6]